ncbi:hypothetical protein PEPS_44330 (plasmid) [Persicobacter psychrovividus]|uniref:Uncharacterized protein n=1 Tax=Persicobacter psychrovividus TaxID=387638 RepID=A0ABM7VMA7_9BACT|nr:hypothetical protein PEPS_44330 [Persicobacter psychrovividus]
MVYNTRLSNTFVPIGTDVACNVPTAVEIMILDGVIAYFREATIIPLTLLCHVIQLVKNSLAITSIQ